MRVMFLQRQPCARALKYAVALTAEAPGIELAFAYQGMTLSQFYGTGDELFTRWYRLGIDPDADLSRALDDFEPDLIHSHNLPDVLTVAAQEVTDGRIPIVHDVHDFQSLRRTPYEDGFPDPPDRVAAERAAIERSDAVVTVGRELMDEIDERYRAPARTLLIPNLAMRRDLPELPSPRASMRRRPFRLVYQGTLSVGGGHYDLREIFAGLLTAGVALDVYPSRPASDEYRALERAHGRLTICAPRSPRDLLRALVDYDAGWAGFNATNNGPHLDTVLPNKAFEYVGCGLPVIALPHRALARWIEEEGVGAVVSTPERLLDDLARVDLDGIRAAVRARRERFTMEGAVDQLVDLYEALVTARSERTLLW